MKAIAAALIAIPLTTSTGWETLSFNRIPANKVEFSKQGLSVHVQSSAGPLVYAFKQPEPVFRVDVHGQVTGGGVVLKEPGKQGLKGQDDFPLRLGLVLEGSRRLNWAQRMTAPAWVKKLHALAPPGKGVDKILFLEVSNEPALVGTVRNHYMSELMDEEILTSLKSDGRFELTKHFREPVRVLGLWVSVDGDDTQSKFNVLIENITLYKKPTSSSPDQ